MRCPEEPCGVQPAERLHGNAKALFMRASLKSRRKQVRSVAFRPPDH
jgi:hypothetical protein